MWSRCRNIKRKKLWLFDMDGTIYEENRLFDGTLDLLERIKSDGGRYVYDVGVKTTNKFAPISMAP